MTKFISNSINMIRTVLLFLTNNPTPTAGIAAFAAAKTSATNKLVLIDGLSQIAAVSSEGVTLDTNLIRSAMTAIAFKIASALRAYATTTNNNTLKQKVRYSKTAYSRMKKEVVDDVAQTIHDEGDTNIAAAGAFGYDATDVTDLQTAIDLYRTSVQNPRQAIITKKEAVENIAVLVKDIKENLFKEGIDQMVNTLEVTEPDFVKGYRFAREIIDLGVTHAKVRGSVRNILTAPLAGVTFIITKTGTAEIIGQTVTAANGSFEISNIPADDYDFSFTFSGYQPITETNVHISLGKELQRKITMLQVGATIIREGSVASSGGVTNIDVTGINSNPAATVTIEVTGSPLRFYGSPTDNGTPGATFWDKEIGIITMALELFIALAGVGAPNAFLNVQNNGPSSGHYKLTFTNLEP